MMETRILVAVAALSLLGIAGCGGAEEPPEATDPPSSPRLQPAQAIGAVRGYHAALQHDACTKAGTFVRPVHAKALTHKLTCDALVKKYETYPPASEWELSTVEESEDRTIVGGVIAGKSFRFAVAEREGSPVLLSSSQRRAD